MRIRHFPSGAIPPMPELLRQCFNTPRPTHILDLGIEARHNVIMWTVAGSANTVDHLRAAQFAIAIHTLANLNEQGSL